MLEITVYGPGCSRCRQVEKLVTDVAAKYPDRVLVKKVEDLEAMMDAGIMATPAIALNSTVVSVGIVPTREQVITWVEAGLDQAILHQP